MADFRIAYDFTQLNEGGATYTNRPTDRGGPTKFGITLATLVYWNFRHSLPKPTAVDVEQLREDLARQIYKELYWDPLLLDQVDSQPVATAIFDIGVNDGPGRSVCFAQRALGFNPAAVDGKVGPGTIAALNRIGTGVLPDFIRAVQDHYIQIVINDPTEITNLHGWLNRSLKLIALLV